MLNHLRLINNSLIRTCTLVNAANIQLYSIIPLLITATTTTTSYTASIALLLLIKQILLLLQLLLLFSRLTTTSTAIVPLFTCLHAFYCGLALTVPQLIAFLSLICYVLHDLLLHVDGYN